MGKKVATQKGQTVRRLAIPVASGDDEDLQSVKDQCRTTRKRRGGASKKSPQQIQCDRVSGRRQYAEKRRKFLELTSADTEEAQQALEAYQARRAEVNQRNKERRHQMKAQDPEKYREYLDKIRSYGLAKRALRTEEEREKARRDQWFSRKAFQARLDEDELIKRAKINRERMKRSEEERWKDATEEELAVRRMYINVSRVKLKLKKQLVAQGLAAEEIKRRVEELEVAWWKEKCPKGKPEIKKRKDVTFSKLKWLPPPLPPPHPEACGEEKQESAQSEGAAANDDVGGKFVCVKCSPPVHKSFKSKKDLYKHVREIHPLSYFVCFLCGVLKYSKSSLEAHVKFCDK